MFLRLVYQSFRRQLRSKLLAALAVALGVAVATAMIAVATNIGDRMGRELRSFGANIIVYPETADLANAAGAQLSTQSGAEYLRESDLPKIEGIFWRHNILGFAPFLHSEVAILQNGARNTVPIVGTYFAYDVTFGDQHITTGVLKAHPWWKVNGNWPREREDASQVLVGSELARERNLNLGDLIELAGPGTTARATVSGILTVGGDEDHEIVAPLHLVQALAQEPGAIDQIYVNALTKPEDDFARRNPESLSPADRDRWYCSPYANSIAYQLAEAIPHSRAEQVRRVAQSEGQVLGRIEGLMLLITFAALIAAALAVSAAIATSLLERRPEIGLMKAIGAARALVCAVFYAEAALIAIVAGALGFVGGEFLASAISRQVFGAPIDFEFSLLPLVLLVALAIVLLGSAALIQRATAAEPAIVLRGEA